MATRDPNPQVTGAAPNSSIPGVKVETGLLAAEARRLNEAWFKWAETGLPWVIAKAACSLDGKIATAGGESQWLTGETARAFGHRLRHRVDAILVGIGTVLADDPQLTTRLPRGGGKDPIRVVLDSRLRIPLSAGAAPELRRRPPGWPAPRQPRKRRSRPLRPWARRSWFSRRRGRVALRPLLEVLGRRQVQSVLVEGGAETLGSFFDQRLVDQFYFFYAPKFLGGRTAPGVLGGEGVTRLVEAHQARKLAIRRIGPDLLISGYL